MSDTDIDSAVALLVRGFPERDAAYWRCGLLRLAERIVPDGCPRFGYVLCEGSRLVGIVLLIFSQGRSSRVLANVSSWFVEDGYRGFSSALLAAPFRLKGVTFFNVSPTPATIETITAQGFRRYCEGTFHALPALAGRATRARVRRIAADADPTAPPLARLAACGCLSIEVTDRGETHGFAFLPRRFWHDRLPGAQLVHCSDPAAFVRLAGPIGRYLARRGLLSVMIDANGPIEGLRGRFLAGRRTKYFRGEASPDLNDLGETELVLFGP